MASSSGSVTRQSGGEVRAERASHAGHKMLNTSMHTCRVGHVRFGVHLIEDQLKRCGFCCLECVYLLGHYRRVYLYLRQSGWGEVRALHAHHAGHKMLNKSVHTCQREGAAKVNPPTKL